MVTASVLALLLSAPCPPEPTRSQVPQEGYNTAFALYTDQDTFQIPSTDQDYTMGVQFTFSGCWVEKRRFDAPLQLLDRLFHVDGLMQRRADGGVRSHSFSFGDSAFTPLKGKDGVILAETAPRYDDRPYANILFASVRRQTFRYHTAVTSELTVGLLGLRVGRAVQTWIHQHKGDVTPGGWPHQISNGGEPTLRYRVAVQQLLFRAFTHDTAARRVEGDDVRRDAETIALAGANPAKVRWIDSAVDVEGNLGYYTNLGGGVKVRAGRIMSSPFGERQAINTTKAFPRSRARSASATEDDRGSHPSWELYGWGGLGGYVWAYNALFQGQFRDSDVTMGFSPRPPSHSTLRRVTGEWQAGVTFAVKWLSLSYVRSEHTRLFDGPNARTHGWGGLYLTIAR